MTQVADRQKGSTSAPLTPTRVHVVQTGSLVGNATFMRGEGWSSLLRPRRDFEFPVYAYLLEHSEGLIAIDTGMSVTTRVPLTQRRFVPSPRIEPNQEIGPRMRAHGLRPEDVSRVILTHLDWDHAGGVAHFPNAEVLAHRPEDEFARTLMGRMRYQPKRWPAGFEPTLYDLEAEPFGPFPASRRLTAAGDVRIVPLPGHSVAQVGVVADTPDGALLFSADHVLRQDWCLEDLLLGRDKGLGGPFYPEQAAKTTRRIARLAAERPTVLLPSHDAQAPARLAVMAPLEIS